MLSNTKKICTKQKVINMFRRLGWRNFWWSQRFFRHVNFNQWLRFRVSWEQYFEDTFIYRAGQQIPLEYLHIIISSVANAQPCLICLSCIVWHEFAYTCTVFAHVLQCTLYSIVWLRFAYTHFVFAHILYCICIVWLGFAYIGYLGGCRSAQAVKLTVGQIWIQIEPKLIFHPTSSGLILLDGAVKS